MLSYMFAEVVSTAVMPQEDAREEAEYDEIRHEEATDPDSLYANNSFLQDIGSAAAGCETNSRGACAESRDNVLYSVAQLPKDQIKPTGQSQRNQSESAENDSFYDLSRSRLKSVTSEQTLSNSLRSAAGLQTLVHDEQKNSAGNGSVLAHTSDPNQLKEVSTLLAINTKLSLENTNLMRDIQNLKDQLGNLTQAYNVSESNNKNLSAGVQELKTRNHELETKTKNLTQQIQDMTTNWNVLSISRAQWSIDSYCLGYTDKKCKACQKGWNTMSPAAMGIITLVLLVGKPGKKLEKTAKERIQIWLLHIIQLKRSLCVYYSLMFKYLTTLSLFSRQQSKKKALDKGYWIGLRVVNKQWKWVDGSNLTDSSWIDLPDPVDGRCAGFTRAETHGQQ
ncbi:hypothetical protein F7725_017830 [Dissostichus mawsoni]|uniref:C-type lectin domain-containing protein n=1 Tax=Dissostichus mawsoni TaxID=36200 RepID=A0A7J5XQI7_DISMA|nr:hypothetical protein F7725_017830 [Dissostichus mawsoni]